VTLSTDRSNFSGRFVFIDGLRGVAALSVAIFHCFNHWVSPIHDQLAAVLPNWIQTILEHGDLGVEIFFVLSGFVIAHSLADRTLNARFAGNFIVRRSLRLDPPYWVVLAFCMIWPYLVFPHKAVGMFNEFGGVSGMLVNMFYLPDLLWKPRILGVAWTLCLEVQFYLAYLALMMILQFCLSRFRLRKSIRVGIAAVLFAPLAIYSLHRWFSINKNDFGGRWFMFFSGVVLYWTLRNRVPRAWLGLYLAVVIAFGLITREPRSIAIACTCLAIYASAMLGGLRTWLRWSPFQHLGRLSYSFYLVHMQVGVATIAIVQKFGDGSTTSVFTAAGAALVASIITAELLNRFVEVPAMNLSQRFKQSKPPQSKPRKQTVDAQSAAIDESPLALAAT